MSRHEVGPRALEIQPRGVMGPTYGETAFGAEFKVGALHLGTGNARAFKEDFQAKEP